MGLSDIILKQVVAGDAPTFAAWLLGVEVDVVEALTIELPADSVRADTVFRAQQDDGQTVVLHIEFQGRTSRPAETMPQVVAAIRTQPDAARQELLFEQLFALLRDEEVIAMTQQLLTDEDLEDMKQFPLLWQSYQRHLVDGQRRQARADILEVLVARFDPPVSEYQKVEQALATIDDTARLSHLHRHALRANDLASFIREVGAMSEQTEG